MYRAEPKEPTQFGFVSGSEIQNLTFSLSGIVYLYRSEPKEPTQFGSVTGSEIQNLCISRNLAIHFSLSSVPFTISQQLGVTKTKFNGRTTAIKQFQTRELRKFVRAT